MPPAFEPCGPHLGGELETRPVTPVDRCAHRTERLAPGDSIAMEIAVILESRPGRYLLRLEDSGLGRRTAEAGEEPPVEWSYGNEVQVVADSVRRNRIAAPVEPPGETVRYAIDVARDSGIQEWQVHEVVQQALRTSGRFPLALTRSAADLAPPYLSIELGRTRLRLHWVCGETVDEGLRFLEDPERDAREQRPPFLTGAILALMIRGQMDEPEKARRRGALYFRCPPPGVPIGEPGGASTGDSSSHSPAGRSRNRSTSAAIDR